MKLSNLFAMTLTVATFTAATLAQQNSPAEKPGEGCDTLTGFVPGNVQSIAGALNICPQVQRVLLSHSRIPPGSFAEQQVAPGERPQGGGTANAESEKAAMETLEARQRISEAITRATLDSNLVSLELRNAMLERQISSFNEEQRAYRRTKILNAFLGTTVGALGSGLQFSDNVSVQHAGDGISVAGGAITAVFALCTAGIDEKDNPPDNVMSQAVRSDNAEHQMPDDVWSYLKGQGVLPVLEESFAPAPPAKTRWLSCHLRGAPAVEKQILKREKALGTLNNALLRMNRDLNDLSSVVLRHEVTQNVR